MQNDKIDRWIVVAGFMTLAVILAIEGVALFHLLGIPMRFQPPAMQWPETIMRLLFGQGR